MKKFIQLLIMVVCLSTISPQDLQQVQSQKNNSANVPDQINKTLSYVYEDFEEKRFPPAGWIIDTKLPLWVHFDGASAYGKGSASAKFNISAAGVVAGISQSLVLSSMGSSIPGDSLQFDHAYCTYSGMNDRLIIETSTNGGTTYSNLVTLNGGTSGPLVTAPPQAEWFIPAATQWKTKRYALPVGTNQVRFKAVSECGNNIYIDNCIIGHQSNIDVGTQSIDVPNRLAIWNWTPKVTVENHGTVPQTFTVTLLISPDGYSSTKTVTELPGNAKSEVLFESWSPIEGTYTLTAFVTLAGDMDPSNDTLHSKVLVSGTGQVSNIEALSKNGQVFVTWDNLNLRNVIYTLYKSPRPIQYGFQLSSAQNLGTVMDNSAIDERLTEIFDTLTYLRIDSASSPLLSNNGLFVATSIDPGSFYYAVTANVGEVEDTTIVFGSNSLATPISEDVQFPKPVWQQSTSLWGNKADIYVQFATKITTSIYPQMTNVGSFPFHFALVKFGNKPHHPLTVRLHGRWQYGSFLEEGYPSGIQNEWMITIDDWIPNGHGDTFFYGYHEDYNIRSNQNQCPTSGIICNYTSARIKYTLDWAIRNLPVDSTRVYMCGISAGADGTLLNALMIPERIAAFFIYVPTMNISNSWWWEEQWGKPANNLMTNEGYKRNDRINATFLLGLQKSSYIPIMYTFCGKQDGSAVWNDKPPFYNAMNNYQHGGFHFWSNTDHEQTFANSPWKPSFPDFSFFTRYRTNLSYPAFSNCSINDKPGNGTPSHGAPIGSINGHLDWDDNIIDLANRWEIKLYLKDLKNTSGSDNAPDSAKTDVTLRRLQNFSVPEGLQINWENHRNNILVQRGSFVYDSGLVTIKGVKVYKDSSRLSITYGAVLVDEIKGLPIEYALIQNYPNPFNPTTSIQYSIANRQFVTLKIFNVLGQEIETLVNEEKTAGNYQVEFNAAELPSGVYFYRIQAGSFNQVRKMLLIK